MWLVGFLAAFVWTVGVRGAGADEPFDLQPVLEHNKAWLQPDVGHLDSVAFDTVP